MDLDTYYDNHQLNPANQPEPESVISYEVIIHDGFDEAEAVFGFDTPEQAEQRFNEIAYGIEFDFFGLCLYKLIDGAYDKCIKSALSSTLFLEMKRNLARIREIEVNAPMGLTSDEQQEIVELKRKLYGSL